MTDKDRMEQSGEIDEFWELDDASDTSAQKGSGKRQEGQDTVGRKASPHSTASRRSGSRRGVSGKNTGRRRKRKNTETYVHYIIAAVLAAMLIFAVVKLVVWNIGKDSGYDPNADSSEFEVEALDYIQPLDPELLKGREDDGVNTIVCLGNHPFSDERGKDGLAELIANKCGATVYNGAFPDSYISMKNTEYTDSYPQDALSLYLVTASICGGNFDLMEHAVDLLSESDKAYREALDTLKSVDFSKVDMIVIMYDLNDYMDKRPVMDENNDINLLTWNGALNASLQEIQKTYPYIRLVVLSPSYGQFEDGGGKMVNGDTEDFGNGVLPDYVLHEIDVAMANGVSILDNYYGTINEDEAKNCLTDGYRLNKKGREKVAGRFAKEIFHVGEEK